MFAVAGVTVTVTGERSVTAADADFDPSATLVAVTVTACCAATEAGAVYKPVALIVPAVAVQVTPALPGSFATVAANCRVCPPYKLADVGVTETDTGGSKVTVADVDFV